MGREIVPSQKIADHLWIVTGRRKRLEHVESLAEWNDREIDEIVKRAMGMSLVPEIEQLGIRTTVLLMLPRGGMRALPETLTRVRGSLRIGLDVRYRRLWEIPAREIFAMRRVPALPLIPLSSHSPADAEKAALRLKREGDEDLMAQFLSNAAYVYNKEQIERFKMLFVKETEEIARKTWLGKGLIAEGRKIGKKEGEILGEKRGEKRGEARGEARGKDLGLLEAIRVAVKHRFPALADAPEIDRIPAENAAAVLTAVMDARNLREARAALTAPR